MRCLPSKGGERVTSQAQDSIPGVAGKVLGELLPGSGPLDCAVSFSERFTGWDERQKIEVGQGVAGHIFLAKPSPKLVR
jgi:hypothetical protein